MWTFQELRVGLLLSFLVRDFFFLYKTIHIFFMIIIYLKPTHTGPSIKGSQKVLCRVIKKGSIFAYIKCKCTFLVHTYVTMLYIMYTMLSKTCNQKCCTMINTEIRVKINKQHFTEVLHLIKIHLSSPKHILSCYYLKPRPRNGH